MRDRDTAGRPRNARPRDAFGRPLPRDAVGIPPAVPDDLVVTPSQALAMAQEFLDADRPFPAHEVLEAMWKQCDAAERELWRGLAQLAVGLTHIQRGNTAGAAALLRRGADRIAPYAGADGVGPHGIDVEKLASAAHALADAAAAGVAAAGSAAPARLPRLA